MDSVIRGAGIYFIVLVITRFSGRRSLSEMTPFDFVLLLIVAETTQQALLGDDFSMTNAFVLIITLFTLDIGLSYLKQLSPKAGVVVDGVPTILVDKGQPDEVALQKARIGLDDILETARIQEGLERLDQIRFAIIETSGKISIIPEREQH